MTQAVMAASSTMRIAWPVVEACLRYLRRFMGDFPRSASIPDLTNALPYLDRRL